MMEITHDVTKEIMERRMVDPLLESIEVEILKLIIHQELIIYYNCLTQELYIAQEQVWKKCPSYTYLQVEKLPSPRTSSLIA